MATISDFRILVQDMPIINIICTKNGLYLRCGTP